jgi:hypothetical protein
MRPPSRNTLVLVRAVVADLTARGNDVLLGGGWAEELHGIIPPRDHHDIDLFVVASDLSGIDQYITETGVAEIPEKRLAHKRAFLHEGVIIETMLITMCEAGYR